MSDERGIYDANGLPPGHYSLSVESAAQLDYMRHWSIQHDLNVGDVWGETLHAKRRCLAACWRNIAIALKTTSISAAKEPGSFLEVVTMLSTSADRSCRSVREGNWWLRHLSPACG